MSVYNNNITVIGNLGKPADIVETKAGTVAKFSLAVYRNGKGEEAVTDWLSVVAWHDLARGMATLNKGAKLIIAGSVATRSYEAKDGTTKYVTEIQAREIGSDISIAKDDDIDFTDDDTF
jgi:single-strand DNA-binding protein